jgi:hypothetical protein
VRFFIFILVAINTVNAQSNLSKDLSRLFGNLPMDSSAYEIISIAKSSKNFKGYTHHNLDISYSGVVMKTNFFQLKPDTSFIEIVSYAEDVSPPDSLMKGIFFFSFDAGYGKASSIEIKKEFDRIVKLFSPYFSSGIMKKEDERVNFFKTETGVNPTLILWIGEGRYDGGCYSGKQCIRITYIK